MFVLSPDLATYAKLLAYVRRRFAGTQLTYSDQTGLMCFFGQRAHTLPCAYLYEPANPLYNPGLKRYMKECRVYGKQNVLRNCLAGTQDGCSSWEPRVGCEQVRQNLENNCAWPKVYSEVHAVHFKGKSKPWPSMMRRTMGCRHLRLGMPIVREASTGRGGNATVALEAADLLEWDAATGTCMNRRLQRPVYWQATQCKVTAGSGRCGGVAPIELPKCCTFNTLLAAKWHEHLRKERG